VPKLGPPLRGPPVVVVQNTTKLHSAVNRAVHIGSVDPLLEQFVVESLVVTRLPAGAIKSTESLVLQLGGVSAQDGAGALAPVAINTVLQSPPPPFDLTQTSVGTAWFGTIPEPSTTSMLGLGLVAVASLRRSRSR